MIFNMWWCVSIIMTSLHVPFNPLLMEICYHVQLDRLGKEFIVPLEKQISSEQEEKQVVQKETQEIVGQKRRACTINLSVIITDTTSISTSLLFGVEQRRELRAPSHEVVLPPNALPRVVLQTPINTHSAQAPPRKIFHPC